MGCFADRRVLLVAAALLATLGTALSAIVTCADAGALSVDAQTRAIGAIAARWGVPATEIRVEWIEPLPVAASGEITLRGTGAQGHWTVDVRGAGGHVTRGRLRAGTATRVARAARDIPRGATVAAADILWTDTVAWGPPARSEAATAEGWTARRLIVAGEALVAPAVAPPMWVRAGEDVRVIVVRGSLELAMPGRAAGSGVAGDRVAVRASTGRRLTGTITAPGVVRVDAGKDL